MKEKTIVIKKEDSAANYIIAMFSIINEATSNTNVDFDENMVPFFVEKENDEIFEFDQTNLNDLKKLIYIDFFQKSPNSILVLNEIESDLFRKCSHAAYYFETERQRKNKEHIRFDFLEYHEINFLNK